nr:gamma-glutamylcyclotransferase family protein [Enterobacter sp. Bisph1]
MRAAPGLSYPARFITTGFPALVLDKEGSRVEGYLFFSARLPAHWPMLDEFEAGYDRVKTTVTTLEGECVSAWVYQIQPRITG